MGGASNRDTLLTTLEPVVSACGFDLEDVVVTPAGKRRVLRVVVDKDGGVDLDDIAGVSTSVSATLDESNAMGAVPYVLEVTSPGVDRPLTLPRHWRRATDRLVQVDIAGIGSDRTENVASDDGGGFIRDAVRGDIVLDDLLDEASSSGSDDERYSFLGQFGLSHWVSLGRVSL